MHSILAQLKFKYKVNYWDQGGAFLSKYTIIHVIFNTIIFVIGYEKRVNFAQNAIFWHFSNCHHSKASTVSDFPLGL